MSTNLSLVFLLLAAQEPTPAPPAPFTAARFREHVAYLADDELAGRDVGSAGSAKAMDYLIRHLKESGAQGLSPGNDYYQAFPYTTRVRVRPDSSLAVVDGPAFALGKDFSPTPLSPDGRWEGDVAFAGYGLSNPKRGYDNFAGVELKGKVALLLANLPKQIIDAGQYAPLEQRCEECRRRGAIAVAAVLPKGARTGLAEQGVDAAATPAQISCMWLTHEAAAKLFAPAEGAADPVSTLEASVAADGRLKPSAQQSKAKVRLVVHQDRTPITGRNVLALVPGKGELGRQAILVSAHHDHMGTDPERVKAGQDGIFNGADDNASGCAALLLVAAALHADRDRLPASCRSVIFASFDAEERGLTGSRHYVSHPLWPLGQTTADINFDMVGRLGRHKVNAFDSESSAFLTRRILTLAPACGLRVETRLSGARRADNASFLDREIPAVHFNSGLHADYHQVSDEVGKIDAEGGARVAWLAYRLLRDTMEAPGPLPYQRPPPGTDLQSILQFLVRLGIYPEQNAQAGRYPLIRFVMPGSPAARFGLKSDDEVLGIDGGRFEGLEDAALAFSRVRLDRDVRLTVRRKGKESEVKIPAEVFKDMAGPATRSVGKDRFEAVFRYKPAAKAKSVTLAGTFNKWDVKAQPMEGPDKDGYYTTRLVLAEGNYEYKFVVDGQTWVADPTNFRHTGPYGNSVLMVGGQP
jgi:hypothetical protein